jgi:DNA-binding MarR family transcriptional regulator
VESMKKETESRTDNKRCLHHGELEQRAARAMRRMIQLRDIHSRRLMSKFDTSLPQVIVLRSMLAHAGVANTTEIANASFLTPSTVVRIADNLEKKGLMERERQGKDRREVHLKLTPKGFELLERIHKVNLCGIEALIQELPEKKLKVLVEVWEELVDIFEKGLSDSSKTEE